MIVCSDPFVYVTFKYWLKLSCKEQKNHQSSKTREVDQLRLNFVYVYLMGNSHTLESMSRNLSNPNKGLPKSKTITSNFSAGKSCSQRELKETSPNALCVSRIQFLFKIVILYHNFPKTKAFSQSNNEQAPVQCQEDPLYSPISPGVVDFSSESGDGFFALWNWETFLRSMKSLGLTPQEQT